VSLMRTDRSASAGNTQTVSLRVDNRRSEREQSKLACYAEPQGGKGRQALNGKVGDVAAATAEVT